MEKGVGRELKTITDSAARRHNPKTPRAVVFCERLPEQPLDEHGEMKQEVYNLAAYAIEQYVTEMEVSKHIKAHFDQKYGPTWHCIVGSDFRAYVTHEQNFIFFYQGKTAICLYKCG
ncbi:hypothetical protein JL722_1296 [Aureococcus anophagefferens]|nr:hypothetical protein JL722_1296 [Aureococcus anophagefferens]